MATEMADDLPAFLVIFNFVVDQNQRYGQYKINVSYIIFYWYVISLFVLFGRQPSTMDAISATVVKKVGQEIC